MNAAGRTRPVVGAGLMFASNGAVFASLLPWYPLVKERLGLSDTEFGLVVACVAVGAVASSALPAPLLRRYGAVRVAIGGTLVVVLAVAATGWAPVGIALAGCVLVAGFADAMADVAQNVAAIRVQQRSGRQILGSMHALWSVGAAAGAAVATWAATTGIDMRLHLALSGTVGLGLVVLGALMTGAGAAQPEAEAASTGPSRRRVVALLMLPLVLVALSGTVVEDVANNWAAVAGVQLTGLAPQTAGIAFTIVLVSQCVGRFTGDLLISRIGRALTARIGGLLVLAGGVVVVLAQVPPVLGVGMALLGYGCATLVPSAFAAAAELPGVAEGTGVTLVSWLMRLGFLVTSPVVGLLSDLVDLRVGLLVLVLAGLTATAFAGRLAPTRAQPDD